MKPYGIDVSGCSFLINEKGELKMRKYKKILIAWAVISPVLVLLGTNLWWKILPVPFESDPARTSGPHFDGIYDIADSSALPGNLHNWLRLSQFFEGAKDGVRISTITNNGMAFSSIRAEVGRSVKESSSYPRNHVYADVPADGEKPHTYRIFVGSIVRQRSFLGTCSGRWMLTSGGIGFRTEGLGFSPYLLGSVWHRMFYSLERGNDPNTLHFAANLEHGGTALLILPWRDPDESYHVTLKKRKPQLSNMDP
ncbi:MAG: hypothetical protein J6334_08460 [Kiritimatiellae bacterium]|nr:hypothetical protein [Kiritimatiellia bacterium]